VEEAKYLFNKWKTKMLNKLEQNVHWQSYKASTSLQKEVGPHKKRLLSGNSFERNPKKAL
jgi:hypothetical protein